MEDNYGFAGLRLLVNDKCRL